MSEDFGEISESKALCDKITKPRAFMKLHQQGEKVKYVHIEREVVSCPNSLCESKLQGT